MGTRAPEEIYLEFARAEDAGDPFAFSFAEQAYLLHDEGGAVESARFPWGDEVLKDLRALQSPRPDRAAVQRLGDTLRRFLEQLGWAAHEARIERARAEGRPVHLTIRSAAAELYALPWELVASPSTGQHLGELSGFLVRYEWPDTRTAARVPDPPPEEGRILFAWSGAGGVVPAEDHLDAICCAAFEGHVRFDQARDVVPNVSLASLSRALAEPGPPVAVLHILCHGGAAPSDTASFGLMLDAADGGAAPDAIDAGTLRQTLAPYAGSLSLVVLAACYGGNIGALNGHLGSVAQALHRVGIPAVVASRYPLSTEGSTALARTLYWRLLVELGSLEEAFLAARAQLAERAERFDWASLQLYARAADGPDHRPVVFRPYRGLHAFLRKDDRFYFGREDDVERLVAALRKGRRLITLVGASGSGKTSLVLAGLIPVLERSALGKAYIDVRVLHPGQRPCGALAAAFARDGDPAEILAALLRRPEALAEAASRALAGKPDVERLFLIVDQFEELIIGGADRAEVDAFVAALLHVVSHAESRVSAVLTLRADFLGRFLDDGALAAPIRESMDIVLPLGEAEIVEAIVRPAERAGLWFDEGLVDAIVGALREGGASDLASTDALATHGSIAAGDLPLLEFALEELWERRCGNHISWSTWRTIGGVRGAIARRADQVLAAHPESERALVRDLFGRLVQLGEATVDTRRRAPRTELESVVPGRAGPILDRWIDARLLTADETEIGIAHDALIREWATLRGWIDERREALRVAQAVSRDVVRWERAGKNPDDLWRGGRLKRALELWEAGTLALSTAEAKFLVEAEAGERLAREHVEAEMLRAAQFNPRIGARERAVAVTLIFVVILVMALVLVHDLRRDLSGRTLTHGAIAMVSAPGVVLIAVIVLIFRQALLATMINRRVVALHAVAVVWILLNHFVASEMGISANHALVVDLLLLGIANAAIGLTFPVALLSAVLFSAAAVAAARWPDKVIALWCGVIVSSAALSAFVYRYRPAWIVPR